MPEPKDKIPKELPGEESEVSDRELAAILEGKPTSKKWIIISSSAGAALVAAFILFWGGGWEKIEGIFSSAKPDTIRTDSLKITASETAMGPTDSTERHLTGAFPDSLAMNKLLADTTISKLNVLEPVKLELSKAETAVYQEPGWAVTSADTSIFPADEEFFRMLNAEVSPEELSKLEGLTLDDILFTPVLPRQPAYSPLRTDLVPLYTGALQPAATPPVSVDTTRVMVTDSMRYLEAIDSLELQIVQLNRNLETAKDYNSQLERRLQRVSGAADSLRQRDVKKLAKIIELMAPEAAAATLRDLSMEEMSELLFKLKPRQAAKIIQQLPPAAGSELAVKVARQ